MNQEIQNGALIDIRTEEEKRTDFHFNEIVASPAPVVWKEKSPGEWRSFPIFDQDNSSSCVAQTLKKMLGVYVWLSTNYFVPLSASHIYQRRSNRPGEGMSHPDAFEIVKQGTTLEQFAPSENMSDSQMDSVSVKPFMSKIGEVFKIGSYVTLPTGDIETIASIIQQTGKAVMVWFYFSTGQPLKEWVDVPVIKYPNLDKEASTGVARHSVAAVDFTLYNGQKALIIEDSWGKDTAINGRRIITEDFFKARNWFAAHFMNFAFEDQTQPTPLPTPKPVYRFLRDLQFSAVFSIDKDVAALQNVLKYEGLFPTNVDSSGYFGSVTQRAVEQFQAKYSIALAGSAGYGRVGPLTRSKLNELYGQ